MVSRINILKKSQKAVNQQFRYKNTLMRSPIDYTMLERRVLYKLSEEIKKRFQTNSLSDRDSWKNLIFRFSNKDLAIIGGQKNYKKTFDSILGLTERTIVQYGENEQGQLVFGGYHWISSFEFNETTKDYVIRVSPELYDYVIDITEKYTSLDLYVAIRLKSKYTQKFYEIGSMCDNDNQFFEQEAPHRQLKNRVIEMSMDAFRSVFGLSELRMPKTHKLIHKEIYTRFEQARIKVIKKAQTELYTLYKNHESNIWFDYLPGEREGRGRNGGSPKKIFFFFYTYEHPKSTIEEEDRPFAEGDIPLNPFASETEVKTLTANIQSKKNTQTALKTFRRSTSKKSQYGITDWMAMGVPTCRALIKALLDEYFHPMEVEYYIMQIDHEQKQCSESYAQVMQVFHQKLHQAKFENGNQAYRKKIIEDYVFQKNLQDYGWSIPPMNRH